MFRFIKQHKFIFLLVGTLFVFHLLSKDIRSPYERPIAGDAQAYYAYLPAIFIYDDLDYQFMETHAAQYYAPGHLKDFVNEVDGEKVNKTFPGVTVLYSPFFFFAHVHALIAGKPADGFSTIYQFWFDVGFWIYFLFSLIFAKKILEKLRFDSKTILFSIFTIVLATNIFFYTVYDQSVTHIYNLFLINGLILCLLNFKEKQQHKWLVIALFLFALIGITRPTNILIVGLVLFFIPDVNFYKQLFKTVFSVHIWKFILLPLIVFFIPFALWKMQTGNWVVYSYGEEGFDFKNPYFFDFLWSYTKGWMTYTPIVVPLLLIGFWQLLKRSKPQFVIGLVFYLGCIYIFSSWWCWYYGAGMSQRVMIDHYILLLFLGCLSIEWLTEQPIRKYVASAGIALFGFLNIAQAYQIKTGIIQFGSATKEQYWDNFLSFQKKARVYPKMHWKEQENINFYLKSPQKGENYIKNEKGFETFINSENTYSTVFGQECNTIGNSSKLILSFEAKADQKIMNSRAVVSLYEKKTEAASTFVFYFEELLHADEWTLMEFLIEPQNIFSNYVELFFWNGNSNEQITFRNFKLTHYTTTEYM